MLRETRKGMIKLHPNYLGSSVWQEENEDFKTHYAMSFFGGEFFTVNWIGESCRNEGGVSVDGSVYKSPLGILMSHIHEPPLCLQSNILLVHPLGASRWWWLKYSGPFHPHGRTGQVSVFLAVAFVQWTNRWKIYHLSGSSRYNEH